MKPPILSLKIDESYSRSHGGCLGECVVVGSPRIAGTTSPEVKMEHVKSYEGVVWGVGATDASSAFGVVLYAVAKRGFDLALSLVGLMFAAPLMAMIWVAIRLESRGPAIFRQVRVGKDCKPFHILKFRTMVQCFGAPLTIGVEDPRITRVGRFLRKHKLDELPQLINVIRGEMSLVGPRPEATGFINLGDRRQRAVFSVLPGLTAPSSLSFFDLDQELSMTDDPVKHYRSQILPLKIEMNLSYIRERNLAMDIRLVLATLGRLAGFVK
jgi:lipopolysaccharide/colanic/teichoic acid biosynthesis glycosyltransferase